MGLVPLIPKSRDRLIKLQFIYLHGFASGPHSNKADIFRSGFERAGFPLTIPELDGGDFENLTLTRQIETVERIIDDQPGEHFGLIGSSMGGYLAALVGQKRDEVAAIYLMAPAFNFLKRWSDKLSLDFSGEQAIPELINIFHYRYNKDVKLNTFLFKDAKQWDRMAFDRLIPTRIVHGINDESVPIQGSRDFAKNRNGCKVIEVSSDHGLLSHAGWLVEDCLGFFRSQGLASDNPSEADG